MSAAEKLEPMLTIEQVAAMLHISPGRALKLAMFNGLPFDPSSLRFESARVLQWISTLPSTPQPRKHGQIGEWSAAPDIPPLDPPETGGVYAIAAATGHVKIGKAWNIKRRLANLQSANPLPLMLLAVLSEDQAEEGEWHFMLAAHRLDGEWFVPHADVVGAIRDARRIW